MIRQGEMRSLLMREGRSHFHFRRSVIRNNKGRSVLMRNGRSHSVQSSHCLVFDAKGDRS
ncbi:hypothetical protein [Tychonema sp. BBK16]|uniref:hypothetical protein n=1 Tax=Tychonema sp. BBK16 TaxID=2699888 RepID=UPI001F1F2202|nr:hypothetical protein [Tychonema sp. BBK16]MCF6374369.1 hypothetical protein [Tychonema sp. BBK16]